MMRRIVLTVLAAFAVTWVALQLAEWVVDMTIKMQQIKMERTDQFNKVIKI
jgi:hypothetical protein